MIKKLIGILSLLSIAFIVQAQNKYKTFQINQRGDTINALDQKGLKQGKWVVLQPAQRGEPGFEEEGIFVDGIKEGVWRKYTLEGDFLGFENFLHGGKDGIQQYHLPSGELVMIESWKGYNPDAPYDTIPVYGTGSGEIISMKVVKAQQYSVRHGEWKYYNPETGALIRTENYEYNRLLPPKKSKAEEELLALEAADGGEATMDKDKKKPPKTAQMLEWEKKNKGKKKVIRDGRTGY